MQRTGIFANALQTQTDIHTHAYTHIKVTKNVYAYKLSTKGNYFQVPTNYTTELRTTVNRTPPITYTHTHTHTCTHI